MILLLAAALAGPAMVTAIKGEVSLGDEAAPPAPFLLAEDQTLQVAAGATVVVIYDGAATQITGPTALTVGDLQGAVAADGEELGVLEDILERTTTVGSVGASRMVGDVSLDRPLAGGTVIQPGLIRWSCTCGDQEVQIRVDDRVLWSAEGKGSVRYDGSRLEPGTYALLVGPNEFSFRVASAPQIAEVEAAVAAAKAATASLDPAAATSVVSSVYLQAGMPGESLRLVDEAIAASPEDADLEALLVSLETQLGLRD